MDFPSGSEDEYEGEVAVQDPNAEIDMTKLFYHPVTKDKPARFYISKGVSPQRHEEIMNLILDHGGMYLEGDIYHTPEPNIDFIICTQRQHYEQEKLRFDLSRQTYVIFATKLKQYVRERRFYYPQVKFENMGGRRPGSFREKFTSEDDDTLCRILAKHIPNKIDGGRMGLSFWKQICANRRDIKGVNRHTPESWRERYKRHFQRLDPIIERYVRTLYPPEPSGKGQYYLKRLEHQSTKTLVPRLETPRQNDQDEYEEEEEGGGEEEESDWEVQPEEFARDEMPTADAVPPPAKRRRVTESVLSGNRAGKQRAARHSDPVPPRQNLSDDDTEAMYEHQPVQSDDNEPGPSQPRPANATTANTTTANGRPIPPPRSSAITEPLSSQSTLVASQAPVPTQSQKPKPRPKPVKPPVMGPPPVPIRPDTASDPPLRVASPYMPPPSPRLPRTPRGSVLPPSQHADDVPQTGERSFSRTASRGADIVPPSPRPVPTPRLSQVAEPQRQVSERVNQTPERARAISERPDNAAEPVMRTQEQRGQRQLKGRRGRPPGLLESEISEEDQRPSKRPRREDGEEKAVEKGAQDAPYRNTRARSRSASVEPVAVKERRNAKGKGKQVRLQSAIPEAEEEDEDEGGEGSEHDDVAAEVDGALETGGGRELSPDDARTQEILSAELPGPPRPSGTRTTRSSVAVAPRIPRASRSQAATRAANPLNASVASRVNARRRGAGFAARPSTAVHVADPAEDSDEAADALLQMMSNSASPSLSSRAVSALLRGIPPRTPRAGGASTAREVDSTSEETFPATGTLARAEQEARNAREEFPPVGSQARAMLEGRRTRATRR